MQTVTLKNIAKDYRSNEAYKTLRTNLEFSGSDNKAIVLTSSTPFTQILELPEAE